MCELSTISQLQTAGTGISAIGAFFESSAQKSALAQEAQAAQTNARLSELTAQSALIAGQDDEQRVRQYGAEVKSAQKVGFAAGNLDLSGGSVERTLTSTDLQTERDALAAKNNAAQEAWGYRMQAANYRGEARAKRAGASGVSPVLSSVDPLLLGATAVAETNYKIRKTQRGY